MVSKEKLRKLAGELLSLAADEFGNHGCNDFDRPKGFTLAEWKELEQDIERWNSREEIAATGYISDFVLMAYLAKKLQKGEL
jgi:hypothetical protein